MQRQRSSKLFSQSCRRLSYRRRHPRYRFGLRAVISSAAIPAADSTLDFFPRESRSGFVRQIRLSPANSCFCHSCQALPRAWLQDHPTNLPRAGASPPAEVKIDSCRVHPGTRAILSEYSARVQGLTTLALTRGRSLPLPTAPWYADSKHRDPIPGNLRTWR